jgi:RNase P subunit RPR2
MNAKDVLDMFPGARILTAEEGRNVVEIDTGWTAIQAERARWQVNDQGDWREVVTPSPENACKDCRGKLIEARWPDANVTVQCHGCGRDPNTRHAARRPLRASPHVAPAADPTPDDSRKAIASQGKRGGVFCRNCYRPMQVTIVAGGYNWACSDCAVVWRYRTNGEPEKIA